MIWVNNHLIPTHLFPNNETRIDGSKILELMDFGTEHEVTVKFKYEIDQDLIHLLFIKNFLDEWDQKVNLTILYMPYSRMDRQEHTDILFTLKYVAKLINFMNFQSVRVIEPHSDVTPALLDRCFADYDLGVALQISAQRIMGFDRDRDVLFFPDAGAQKRYGKIVTEGTNVMVGNKHRDVKTGRITSLDVVGNAPSGPFKVLIVDDLCSYGGTFLKSAEKLRALGATEVYLSVVHCEDSIHQGKLLTSGLIDKVFTTETLLSPCGEEKKIEVVYPVTHL